METLICGRDGTSLQRPSSVGWIYWGRLFHAAQDKLNQLLKLTERYCVVYQTIRNGPPVAISLARA